MWTVCPGTSSLCSLIRPVKRGTIKVVLGTWQLTVSDWSNVMFTDESRFAQEPDDNGIRIWRKQGNTQSAPNVTNITESKAEAI
ncbi:hypothetical protein TNCV_409611 [Trichonephila clavipes]|nr:hypothetical protein TNCV_409611 [Trichonephila clavipes]